MIEIASDSSKGYIPCGRFVPQAPYIASVMPEWDARPNRADLDRHEWSKLLKKKS